MQKIYELRLLYAGDRVQAEHFLNKYYVGTAESRTFLENRMRMFINVPSWINFLSKMDFGVGSCIHGSIASILAGNPTLLFAADSRVRELAAYHQIPMKKMEDINDTTNLKSVYEEMDFSMVLKGHKNRYQIFKNFFKRNKVPTVNVSYGTITDFDKRMNQIVLEEPEGVSCYISLSVEEQRIHLERYLKLCEPKINWCSREIEKGKVKYEKNLRQWEDSRLCTIERMENLR